ncbi:MAG: sugar ABC transporter ATP-binding protein [Anaerolineae bacterium]|nr:sugar ABC transporter ATP-binding protein [Anaerolineae bacterium]
MSSEIIELKGISKQFRSLHALRNVNFDLRPGETHALVGENGAGKSTLMRILAGVYDGYDGEYWLNGKQVHFHSPKEALNAGIGMIHQELSTMPVLTVAENLFLGRQPLTRYGTVDWKKMQQVAQQELTNLGFPEIDVRLPLSSYSLGIQQVVEVLRVILSGAQVLIMDEPTSALSPAEVDRLIQLIDTLRQQKRSIVYISHFLEEVMRVADRITVLRDGSKVGTLERKDASVNQLISLILGREVNATLPSALPEATERDHTLLQVSDLSSDVFSNVSLDVLAGQVLGIYGPIGAGHFDLARAIFGMYRFDQGTVTVDGQLLPRNFSARQAIKHGLAYVTESRRKGLFLDEPIYRNVTLPHLARLGAFVPNRDHELKVAVPAIRRTNVQPPDPLNAAGKLSGGNQQKVALARWLTFPPKVLIASEPTRGMDVGAKNEVLGILRTLRNEHYGVLVASSEPETVLAVADRILVMSHGRVVAQMDNKNLDKEALMRLI